VTMAALRPSATATDFFRKEGAESSKIVQEGQLASPAKVARDGYEAILRGDNSIVSGLKNKVMDVIGDLMPDTLRATRSKKQHEPSSSRKKKPA
jgi:uncharacterized protein